MTPEERLTRYETQALNGGVTSYHKRLYIYGKRSGHGQPLDPQYTIDRVLVTRQNALDYLKAEEAPPAATEQP